MTFYAYVDDNGISYVGYFAGNPHDRITVYSDGTNSLGWYDNGEDPNEKTKGKGIPCLRLYFGKKAAYFFRECCFPAPHSLCMTRSPV